METQQGTPPAAPDEERITPDETTTLDLLGKSFTVRELNAGDLEDLEDLIGFSPRELVDPKKISAKVARAMVWVCIRKSGLTDDQILAREWAIEFDRLRLLSVAESAAMVSALAGFFVSPASEETEPD